MQRIGEVRTERLILQRIGSLDVENMRSLHGDPNVMAALGGIRTAAQTQAEVESLSKHWAQHGFGPWIVREAISNRFVGMGGLHRVSIEEVAEIAIGYMAHITLERDEHHCATSVSKTQYLWRR
jgi:ribosomal-protein-alanine N-acetyltransferase